MKVLVKEKLSQHKHITPEGYLICIDAILARTGKQEYRKSELWRDASDEIIDVDRKPEEVFDAATIASFENKPVTIEHPDEDVNSTNWKEYQVGFVRDVRQSTVDGQDVLIGNLIIQDKEAIDLIQSGEMTELSCGYNCDIKDEDEPQQRNIRGNHIALCEQGRAGNARIIDSYNSYKEVENAIKEKHKLDKKYVDKNGSYAIAEWSDIKNGWVTANGKLFKSLDELTRYMKTNGFMLKDSDIIDNKLINDIALRKGDWFIVESPRDIEDIVLYKVVDDRIQSTNGFTPSILVETHRVDYDPYDKHSKPRLIKEGLETFRQTDLSHATVFNSADKAFNWVKLRMSTIKRDSKVDDDNISQASNVVAKLAKYGNTTSEIITGIKQHYPHLSIDELQIAINEGMKKAGAKNFSISKSELMRDSIVRVLWKKDDYKIISFDNERYTALYKEEPLFEAFDLAYAKRLVNKIMLNPEKYKHEYSALNDSTMKDSKIKDDNIFYGGIKESKLRTSRDFKLKEYFEELEDYRNDKNPNKEFYARNARDIMNDINKRLKQIEHVPNDIFDSKVNDMTKLDELFDYIVENNIKYSIEVYNDRYRINNRQDYNDVKTFAKKLGYKGNFDDGSMTFQYVQDSKVEDRWSGTRNGIVYTYYNGKYYITHRNGKTEVLSEEAFNNIKELYKYVDNIKDYMKDTSDPIVVEFKENKHLVEKLKILAKDYGLHKIRPILEQEKDFNPKMSNAQIKQAAKELGIQLHDSKVNNNDINSVINTIKIIKLHKDSKVKDSDTLYKLAYELGQLANYFDRVNASNSRELLAKDDDTKIAQFYTLGLKVLAQLKKENEQMSKHKEATYSFDTNKIVALILDAANKMYYMYSFTRSDANVKKFELLSTKLKEQAKLYNKLAIK